jgi:addiction module RelE/StbE family toxin
MHKVRWEDEALEDLSKLTESNERRIKLQVEKHLASHPLQNSRPLWGKWQGFYRYRFDKYRVIFEIIYEIREKEEIIAIVKVGERKQGQIDDIYRSELFSTKK